MIKVNINKPIKTTITNEEEFYEGDKDFFGDEQYSLSLVRNNGAFKETPSDSKSKFLSLYGGEDNLIGGKLNKKVYPSPVSLSDLGNNLSVTVPTDPNKKKQPNAVSSVFPSSFSDPFKLKYGLFDTENLDDVYGQSSKAVKSFKPLSVSGRSSNKYIGSDLENVNFFEYEGDLYFICEKFDEDAKNEKSVVIYRFDENTKEFQLVHKFQEIAVDNVGADDAQVGCPDVTVMDGTIFVAYRFVDRVKGGSGSKNNIVIWKTDNDDLSDWSYTAIRVPNTTTIDYDKPSIGDVEETLRGPEGEHLKKGWKKRPSLGMYDNGFRLRIASGAGALCIVYLGKHTSKSPEADTDEGDYPYQEKIDFRTFVSFDEGNNWRSNQENFATFHQDGDTDEYLESRRYSGTQSYFKPANHSRPDIFDSDIFTNVNFDLFFDKSMGSFVIIKSGDSFLTSDRSQIDKEAGPKTEGFLSYFEDDKTKNTSGRYDDSQSEGYDNREELKDGRGGNLNSSHLMAIKTVDDSFLNWELCLDLPLDGQIRGGIQKQDYTGTKNEKMAYSEILDVSVVNRGAKNELYMVCKTGQEHSDLTEMFVREGMHHFNYKDGKDLIVTQSEFAFVSEELISSGEFSFEPVSIGGKFHPSYHFVSSHINSDFYGVITRGFSSNEVSNSVRYQNDFKSPNFYNLTTTSYRNQTLVSAKMVDYDNKFSKMRSFAIAGEWGKGTEIVPYNYNYSRYYYPLKDWGFSEQVSGGGAINYDDTGDKPTNICSISNDGDKAYFTASSDISDGVQSSSKNGRFKFRFTIDITNLQNLSSGELFFLHVGSNNSFYIGVDANNDINLYDGTKTYLAKIFSSVSFDSEKEFVFAYANVNGTQTLKGWQRDYPYGEWSYGQDVGAQSIEVGDSIHIGAYDYSTFVSTDVKIGDLSISINPFGRTEPLFVDKRGSYLPAEGILKAHFANMDNVNYAKYYNNRAVLKDGSLLEFLGKNGPGEDKDTFSYNRSVTYNSPKNLVNDKPNSIYDFTNEWQNVNNSFIEFVFRNDEFMICDFISLLNISGIYQVQGLSGDYDEDSGSWNTVNTGNTKDINYKVLDFVSQSGKEIQIDTNFEKDQLKGRSVFVYDNNSSSWVEHFIIDKNYENKIVIDGSFSFTSSNEIRLMEESFSFDFNPDIASHYGVRLWSTSSASLRALGEIVFGNKYEIQHITNSEDSYESSFGLVKSDFGFTYPSMVYEGNFKTKKTLDAFSEYFDMSNFDKILNIFSDLYNSNNGFSIQFNKDGDKVTRYAHLDGEFSTNDAGMLREISIPLILSNWKTYSNISVENRDPVIRGVELSPSEVIVSNSVTISADAYDPDGDTIEYKWDFGDGTKTSLSSSNQSVSHTYSSVGTYTVQLLVDDGNGGTDIMLKQVEVHEHPVDSYTISRSATVPDVYELLGLTVTAKDSNGDTATHNSSLKLTCDTEEGNYLAVHDDGLALSRVSSLKKHLNKGEATFYVRSYGRFLSTDGSSVNSAKQSVKIYDELGRVVDEQVEFNGSYGTTPNTAITTLNPESASPAGVLTSSDAVEMKGVPVYIVGKQTGSDSSSTIVATEPIFHSGMVGSNIINLTDGSVASVSSVNDSGTNKSDTIDTTLLADGIDNMWDNGDKFVIMTSMLYISTADDKLFKVDSENYEIVSEGNKGDIRRSNLSPSTSKPDAWSIDCENNIEGLDAYSIYRFTDNITKTDSFNSDYVYGIFNSGLKKYNNSFYISERGGTHTASRQSTDTLVDKNASFKDGPESLKGHLVRNTTDGSVGEITEVVSDTELIASLSGGTDDLWQNGDNYEIWYTVRGHSSTPTVGSSTHYALDVSERNKIDWNNSEESGQEIVYYSVGDTLHKLDGNLANRNVANFPYTPLSGANIIEIESAPDGTVLVAFDDAGNHKIHKIDGRTGEKLDTYNPSAVGAMQIDKNGSIVYITDTGQITALDYSDLSSIKSAAPIATTINCLDMDSFGYLYAGYSNGNYIKMDWDLNVIWDASNASNASAHSTAVVGIYVDNNSGHVYTCSKGSSVYKTEQS